jgi:O-antigen/teichoic acid export membrane protein
MTGRHLMIGTISIFIADALILPTGFITAVFLARSLGPVNYGLFALASTLISWIEWTSTSAFSGTTVKFVAEEADWQTVGNTVAQLHLMVGIIVMVLLWLMAAPLSRVFDEPSMTGYLKLFAVEIPIFCLTRANCYILVGMGRFKERARVSACRLISRLILIVLFVETGFSIKGAIVATVGSSLIEWGMTLLYVRPSLFSKHHFPLRRLWDFGLPLFMSSLSLRIFGMDMLALKILGGTAAQVGFYSAATNLAMPFSLISDSLTPPLLSTLSRLFSEKEYAKADEIGKSVIRSAFWLMPFAVVTVAAGSEIVRFIFGEAFLPAGPILSLLIFSATALFVIKVSIAILTALDKPQWTFILTGPMVPVAIAGHLFLIPRWNALGAAFVTTIVGTLAAMAFLFAVYRAWRIFPPLKTILKTTACSVTAYTLTLLWTASGLMLIVKLISLTLVILLIFRLFGEFTDREIALIRSLFQRGKD